MWSTTRIGASSNNDISIKHGGVSDFHAQIAQSANGYSVIDIPGSTGSLLNGNIVEPAVQIPLTDGDSVRLGNTDISLVFRGSATPGIEVEQDNGAVDLLKQLVETPAAPGVPLVPSFAGPVPVDPISDASLELSFHGAIRLEVVSHGEIGAAVQFIKSVRNHPDLRVFRIRNNEKDGVTVQLRLRQPLPLRRILLEIEDVVSVEQVEREDGLPGEDVLLVTLAYVAPPTHDKIAKERMRPRRLPNLRPNL